MGIYGIYVNESGMMCMERIMDLDVDDQGRISVEVNPD